MISRPKFSCGRCRVLVRPSSHTSMAGSLRHFHEQIAEAAQPLLAEGFDLPLRARQLAFLERHHLGALDRAEGARQLAVGGGEVVVPEERHLLLERTARVDHAEQPALTRVLDVRVGRESTGARQDVDVGRVPDLAVYVVGLIVHVHHVGERFERGHALEIRQLRGARAEAGAPQKMSKVFVIDSHSLPSGG
jgi:hypothetical protein